MSDNPERAFGPDDDGEPEPDSAVGPRRSVGPDTDLLLDDIQSDTADQSDSLDDDDVPSPTGPALWRPRTARSVAAPDQGVDETRDNEPVNAHSVAFICAANVCRSPLMEFTFAQSAASSSHRQIWTVKSAGVHVRRTAALCDVAFTLIADEPASKDFTASHSAKPIDAEDLARRDIIITASRDERAAVALLQPSLRTRTFTIKEAVALGREPLAPGELGRATRAIPEDAHPVARYAAVLNARRGSLVPPGQPRMRLPWVAVVDPMDVPDAHHERMRRHVAVLEQLQETTGAFHAQIAAFIDNDAS